MGLGHEFGTATHRARKMGRAGERDSHEALDPAQKPTCRGGQLVDKPTRLPRQGKTGEGVSPPPRIRNALGPFGMVPAGVIESGLSDAAVRLYAYLWRRTQNDNARRPSYATIAADLGWSRAKAKRTAEDLVDAELLTIATRHSDDGSQQTNDYLLEWASDSAPAVPYPEKPAKAPQTTPPPAPQEKIPGIAPEETPTHSPAVVSDLGGGVTSDPGVTHEPGGGSPVTPKEDKDSLSHTAGADTTTARTAATASPGDRVEEAWSEAYRAAHSSPAPPFVRTKARGVAEQLLADGLAVEVAIAAAKSAGSVGLPWVDRYVAGVSRLPGATSAAAGGQTGRGRTYGAPVTAPTVTALRPDEQCENHPGQPRSNCGGCRVDELTTRREPARS